MPFTSLLLSLLLVLMLKLPNNVHSENVALPQNSEFAMIEKSQSQWVTEGQTIELNCKTNVPWNFCRWELPNGKVCDKREGEIYEVACSKDPRIKFKKPKFELLNSGRALNQHEEQYIQDLKSQCTILVMDTTLEDHGTWTCKAKDDAFARDDHAETSIEVNIISHYSLEMIIDFQGTTVIPNLDRNSVIQTLVNDTLIEKVTCVSYGKSQVKPIIRWIANGIDIYPTDEILIESWEVPPDEDDENFSIFQSIVINKGLMDYLKVNLTSKESMLNLECISQQFFTNLTVIYSDSKNKVFEVITESRISEELVKDDLSIPGIIIVTILGLIVILIIILICHAQKQKKWCYATKPNRRIENSDSQNSQLARNHSQQPNENREESTHLVIEESGITENMDGNEINQSRDFESDTSTLEDHNQLADSSIPSNMDQVENSDVGITQPPMNINQSLGFLNQSDERLLEIINSPLPVTNQNDGESNEQSTYRFSLPSLDSGPLSERLTTPIKPINRNPNKYVKMRPASRDSRINSVISSDMEEGAVTVTTQISDVQVHRSQTSSSLSAHETAL